MCGIFGCINKKTKPLNKASLNLLGIANDARGGDSCGVFIDGKYEIGTGVKKLYSNFIKDNELLKTTQSCQITLGHCRKASVGFITEETAQPVVIRNQNDEIDFVLIHNGTIHNWKELGYKYLKEIPDHYTDSYVMAHIFYNHGFDVLMEYRGAAAFVIVDYRKNKENPTTYLFKGHSLLTSYATVATEERPLFVSIEDCNYWFSSLLEPLKAARFDAKQYCTLQENSLISVENGRMTIVKTYDRSKMFQSAFTTQPTYYNTFNNSVQVLYGNSFESFINKITKSNIQLRQRICLYTDGLYKIHDIPANGSYYMSLYGYPYSGLYYEQNYPLVWFYEGYLVHNKYAYDILCELATTNLLTNEDLAILFPEIIAYFSPIPVFINNTIITSLKPTYTLKAQGSYFIPYLPEYSIIQAKKGKFKCGKIISYQEAQAEQDILFKESQSFSDIDDETMILFNNYIKKHIEE